MMPAYPAPLDHELSEVELAQAISRAILDPLNPGDPFTAHAHYFVDCLIGQEAHQRKHAIFAANGGEPELSSRIHELCWKWAVAGILVPATGREVGAYQATAYGREFLSEMSGDGLVPLVPGELARVLLERCPGIDDVTLAYSGQSQECFLSGYDEASVILLGSASETALLRLAEAMNDKRAQLGTPELHAASAVHRLAEVAAALRSYRKQIKTALGHGGRWVDDLPTLLEGSNAIRLTRNDAGHPQRLIARRSEAQGLLTLFPHLAEALVTTTVAIEALP